MRPFSTTPATTTAVSNLFIWHWGRSSTVLGRLWSFIVSLLAVSCPLCTSGWNCLSSCFRPIPTWSSGPTPPLSSATAIAESSCSAYRHRTASDCSSCPMYTSTSRCLIRIWGCRVLLWEWREHHAVCKFINFSCLAIHAISLWFIFGFWGLNRNRLSRCCCVLRLGIFLFRIGFVGFINS